MDHGKVQELLPDVYDYKILNTQYFGNNGFSTIVRLPIFTKEHTLLWLNNFQQKNHVTLRSLRTYEEKTQKLSFKKEYRCIHNTFPKKGSVAHPKHEGCTAKVTVTLKNTCMKRSKDIYLKTHPCEVYIRHTHNHPLFSALTLKYRPPSKELENIFRNLFDKGHSPSSALSIFKDNCLEEYGEKYYEVIADGQKCPTRKWVYDLYYNIFKKEYGEPTGTEMIASLDKFIKYYNEKCNDTCATMSIEGENLAVAICSPIMKRVHTNIKSSSEVMFVDSSGNMDRHNTRIFLFLCPSCVGALPLGILFLYSENEQSITNGIRLLKSILPSQSFYNCGFPKVIITDNCDAERNALQKCFNQSKLLLCKFHVLQAVMRYLWDAKNNVNKNNRTYIYNLFNKTLNCLTVEDFQKQYDYLLHVNCVSSNRNVFQYLNNLIVSATSWAMCYRQEDVTRGNDTNNYCEAMFRIFKDTILQRTKAFSIVQLFDYTTSTFEDYYFKKIMDIINGRWEGSRKNNKYFVDDKKISDLECENIGCNLYRVFNKHTKKEYIVNYELECCSCYVGKTGAACKHQFMVIQKFNLPTQQFHPTINNSNLKYLLHKIITGETCNVTGWYDKNEENSNMVHPMPSTIEKINTSDNENQEENSQFENEKRNRDVENCGIRNGLHDIFEALIKKCETNREEYKKPLEVFIKNFKSCKTDSSLISALYTFGRYNGAALPLIKKGKNTQGGNNIGVQPTAVSRRKSKLAGRKVVHSGRPPKRQRLSDHSYSSVINSDKKVSTVPTNKRKRAPHSLSYCAVNNLSLAKNHNKK